MFEGVLDKAYMASTWVIPALLAIPLHEVAHGYVAYLQGDPTAKAAGRLTLNPIRHIDPFGTIVLPLVLALLTPFVFGWAKPVPVNPRYFQNPRKQMIWVALAGPGINFLLALIAALALHVIGHLPAHPASVWLWQSMIHLIILNLILAVFNLIPLPPLDGSRVAMGILPLPWARKMAALESKGMLIVIGLLFVLPWIGQEIGVNLDILGWLVAKPVTLLGQALLNVVGP